MSYSYTLPSGLEISFREPRNIDRQKVMDLVKPEDKVSADEVLAAYCLDSVNGRPAGQVPDARDRMRAWTIKDTQYYVSLFVRMFTMQDEDDKEVKEAAKKLMSPPLPPTSEPTE